MNICAVIVEYNPFHNGHLYHIQQAKKATNADFIVAIMSGNFVQRGAPGITCKYERARMALSCGADLVIELPIYYALGSAEYFAKGAISLINKLGCITHLCFGSEQGELEPLMEFAKILAVEPEEYSLCLKANLKKGMTYPIARSAALLQTNPALSPYMDALSSPNNILGIEYLKALILTSSNVTPVTIGRIGSSYHEKRLGGDLASATAIREAIKGHADAETYLSYMPSSAVSVLKTWQETHSLLWTDDFSSILRYKLLSEVEKGFSSYIDVSSDLSDRICKMLPQYENISSFCDLLKTKEVTYTRLSRALFHILLDMKQDDMQFYKEKLSLTPYARILGFRKESSDLLTIIHSSCEIPLLTKLADAKNILSEDALKMLQKELDMNRIYYGVLSDKTGNPPRNELSTPITIV